MSPTELFKTKVDVYELAQKIIDTVFDYTTMTEKKPEDIRQIGKAYIAAGNKLTALSIEKESLIGRIQKNKEEMPRITNDLRNIYDKKNEGSSQRKSEEAHLP